eukprot:scaffold3003_cov279-Pinguiococcus_pyrenoidosus.AAC.3
MCYKERETFKNTCRTDTRCELLKKTSVEHPTFSCCDGWRQSLLCIGATAKRERFKIRMIAKQILSTILDRLLGKTLSQALFPYGIPTARDSVRRINVWDGEREHLQNRQRDYIQMGKRLKRRKLTPTEEEMLKAKIEMPFVRAFEMLFRKSGQEHKALVRMGQLWRRKRKKNSMCNAGCHAGIRITGM